MDREPVWQVPLADVRFGSEEIEAAVEVLRSGWISQGPVVERFEAAFAEFLGVKHAVAAASGTAALHLALPGPGPGPGRRGPLSVSHLCGHRQCHWLYRGPARFCGHHRS
ncbi:MAG: DegT/DnrJ/EryC1/StrS family aminotransferase [Thermodesulfobacteriota bacterium]